MPEDVGRDGHQAGTARRPGRTVTTAVAVVLLVGGGTAVAVGLSGPDATPPPALTAPASSNAPVPSSVAPSSPVVPPSEPSTVPSAPPPAPTVAAAAPPPAPAAPPPATAAPRPAPAAPPPAPAADPAEPVRVSIPAIGVESDLLHLGLAEDGSLQVPQGDDFDTAAWFDGSPRPGEVGPAVIEGHVSSRARGPSVFYELGNLAVGDTVDVTRGDGSTVSFEVYDLQQFPKDAFPTLQVYGNTDGPELRLITCGGTIAESSGHFTDNIIVFAREV